MQFTEKIRSWARALKALLLTLWLLSRDASPGQARLDAMIARAGALGYDTGMLRITKQP